MSHLASLENELCAELNITIIRSGLRDVTERSGVQSCVGSAKVRVIEDIEHLGAELECPQSVSHLVLLPKTLWFLILS